MFLNVSRSLLGTSRFLCHDLWNVPGVACLFFQVVYFFSSLLPLPWPSEPLPHIELPLELLRSCFGKLLNWIQDNNTSDHKEYLVYFYQIEIFCPTLFLSDFSCLHWKPTYWTKAIKTILKEKVQITICSCLFQNWSLSYCAQQSWTSSSGRFIDEFWKVEGIL